MMTLLFGELTTGRIGRSAFAKGYCVMLGLLLVIVSLWVLFVDMDETSQEFAHPFLMALSSSLLIAYFWMLVVLQVKRIRDWGVSGWWYLLAFVVNFIPLAPFVLMVMYFAVPRDAFARAAAGAATA